VLEVERACESENLLATWFFRSEGSGENASFFSRMGRGRGETISSTFLEASSSRRASEE
jgi:hypothetical protein